jgi:nucleoside-diphosphate-sugar epimerase
MKKNILITGDNGFIGSYIKKYFQNFYNCSGMSRSDNIDITQYKQIQPLDIYPDTIIHTIASMSSCVEESFLVNVLGTMNICKFAKERKVKHLILISSLSVYHRKENEYFNIYGRTKKQSEEIAESYCNKNNIKLTILRLSQVYDDQGIAKKSQPMLYHFIETIQHKNQIEIFGNNNPMRNYIHIDYLVSVIQNVVENEDTGTYNIIEERSHTITEIAYIIFELLNKKPSIQFLRNKPNIGNVYIPSDMRYNNIESIPLRDGIERIINYDG